MKNILKNNRIYNWLFSNKIYLEKGSIDFEKHKEDFLEEIKKTNSYKERYLLWKNKYETLNKTFIDYTETRFKNLPNLPNLLDNSFEENFFLSFEDESKIIEILKTERRSILLILKNRNLCLRILKESPIYYKDFCSKYNFSENSMYSLITNNIISSFSNSTGRGRKIYIFENEFLTYNNSICVNNYSPLPVIITFFNFYLERSKEYLTERNYIMLENYFYGKDLNFISADLELTKTRIRAIIDDSIRRIKKLELSFKDLDKLKIKYNELEIKYNELEIKYNEFYLSSGKSEFENCSTRLKTILHDNKIYTLEQLSSYSLFELKKIRNLGTRTFNELKDFCIENDINLK